MRQSVLDQCHQEHSQKGGELRNLAMVHGHNSEAKLDGPGLSRNAAASGHVVSGVSLLALGVSGVRVAQFQLGPKAK